MASKFNLFRILCFVLFIDGHIAVGGGGAIGRALSKLLKAKKYNPHGHHFDIGTNWEWKEEFAYKVYHATRIELDSKRKKSKISDCVAIKIPKGKWREMDGKSKMLETEAQVMNEFHQQLHIIRFIEILQFKHETHKLDLPMVVMELGQISFKQYWDELMQERSLTEMQFLQVLKQVLFGLNEMHHKNYVHLDLKEENVIVVNKPEKFPKIGIDKLYLKIIDVGGAVKLEENSEVKKISNGITSTLYEAPEILDRQVPGGYLVSKKADIYSFGMITLRMLSKMPEYKRIYQEMVIDRQIIMKDNIHAGGEKLTDEEFALFVISRKILNGQGNYAEKIKLTSAEHDLLRKFVKELEIRFRRIFTIINQCLSYEPENRPNAHELLEDRFADVDISGIYKSYKSPNRRMELPSSSSAQQIASSSNPTVDSDLSEIKELPKDVRGKGIVRGS